MMKYSNAILFLSLSMVPSINYADMDCSPEQGYLLGRSGEPMRTTCSAEQQALFEKSYLEGQQEFFQISLLQDTLNALDSEISQKEEQCREVDEELNYLHARISELKALPSENQMLSWAESERIRQEQHRSLISQEIDRLVHEKDQQHW